MPRNTQQTEFIPLYEAIASDIPCAVGRISPNFLRVHPFIDADVQKSFGCKVESSLDVCQLQYITLEEVQEKEITVAAIRSYINKRSPLKEGMHKPTELTYGRLRWKVSSDTRQQADVFLTLPQDTVSKVAEEREAMRSYFGLPTRRPIDNGQNFPTHWFTIMRATGKTVNSSAVKSSVPALIRAKIPDQISATEVGLISIPTEDR